MTLLLGWDIEEGLIYLIVVWTMWGQLQGKTTHWSHTHMVSSSLSIQLCTPKRKIHRNILVHVINHVLILATFQEIFCDEVLHFSLPLFCSRFPSTCLVNFYFSLRLPTFSRLVDRKQATRSNLLLSVQIIESINKETVVQVQGNL